MIFIGFNTFLHLLTDSDALLFFKSVKSHMHSDTLFYIDIFVPNPEFLYRRDKRLKNFEYIDSKTNETIYVDDRTIDSHIKRLRKKFRVIDKKFDQIETLYGVGYRYRE